MPREYCTHCQRPQPYCYCNALVKIANRIRVVIIQHPLEQKHPFNTGRIAHLCINNSELIVTETFSDAELENLLSTPSALLYPSLPWLPKTAEIKDGNSDIHQLIVIDATWRKSKKILHLHPALQSLPRINLTGDTTSNYQIRKTSIENGLSTIESIAEAMQMLEPECHFQALLSPFQKMISLQQSGPNTL